MSGWHISALLLAAGLLVYLLAVLQQLAGLWR